ncbi:MAG: hypothetical protein KF782_15330 [Labilithrix sp.]|nr:hypothetical protein [Labilithrix sp.]
MRPTPRRRPRGDVAKPRASAAHRRSHAERARVGLRRLRALVGVDHAGRAALEGKDKDEKQGTRAAQLAFLATQQDPGNADAWLTLGAAYEAMGKKQQAIESYRSCARKAAAHPRVSECKQLAGIKD